ncbi:MAG: M20 family metallopeptidase [Armatimonadota bacterium]
MRPTVRTLEDGTVQAVLAKIDTNVLVELERGAVRVPSPTFEEQECARYLAREMQRLGFDEVEMMEVEDPFGSGRRGIQPIGWLRGSGGGASMMLNGHMDHVPVVGEWNRPPFSGDFDGRFVYGRGAQDDKGGIVAAIGAAAAIKAAGIRLGGDVMVCPVMGHKSGGIGTRAILARGIRPDYCINTENSGSGIARVAVGVIKFLLHAQAKPTHFHSPADVRARFVNPFQQISVLIQRMGSSLKTIKPGGWLTFEYNPELPDYPQLNFDDIRGGYMHTNRATLEVQIRLVPGQSRESVRADVERLLVEARRALPGLDVEIEIPPKTGQYAGWDMPPFSTPPDAPLVQSVVRWHTLAAGHAPVVGAEPRLGAVGDGNVVAGVGTEVIEYGPGSVEEFTQWPTPNERISVEEIVVCAKAIALATAELCG